MNNDVVRLVRVGEMSVDTDKRTVFGTVMPYNEVSLVKDPGGPPYKERFLPGAFTRSIEQRGTQVRLYTMHNRSTGGSPVGEPAEWSDGSDALRASFSFYDTTGGRDALELVRAGGFNGFSVGFGMREGGTRRDGDIVTRTEAGLGEVSLVDIPAYPSATIDGLRIAYEVMFTDDEDLPAFLAALSDKSRSALLEHVRSLDPQDPDPAPQDPLDGDDKQLLIAAARVRLHALKG